MIENGNQSPKELANEIGVHRTTIARYLTGNKIPSVDIIVKLADYFHCSTDYILSLQDDYSKDITFKQCPPFDEQLKYLLKRFQTNRYQIYSKNDDIDDSLLDKWYKGQVKPNIDNIINLAEHFHCSVDFILGRVNYI